LATRAQTWPGRTKSPALLVGSIIASTVRARSWAVMPVRAVRWSTGTVNDVPKGAVFDSTIGASFNRSQTSGSTGTQNWPRPCVIMKLTISGVTFSAAQTKSPSFSRSSASATITTSPRAMASMVASIVENVRVLDINTSNTSKKT
jgi:hypothetical protein